MSAVNSLILELTPEEQEIVDLLQDEMGLPDQEAVMKVLVRQAVQRVAITCPTCGHYARLTEDEQAQCRSCLSVITLSDGIWEASHPGVMG